MKTVKTTRKSHNGWHMITDTFMDGLKIHSEYKFAADGELDYEIYYTYDRFRRLLRIERYEEGEEIVKDFFYDNNRVETVVVSDNGNISIIRNQYLYDIDLNNKYESLLDGKYHLIKCMTRTHVSESAKWADEKILYGTNKKVLYREYWNSECGRREIFVRGHGIFPVEE